MSYYKGKLYLYFGVTPALLLFWPYVALTGHYLLQKDAAVIFCAIGFLSAVGLLYALWRRYFAEVSVAAVAAGMLALGLATGTPALLARCDVWEVSISCGYALTMLALAAIWKALHDSSRRVRWLALASLAYGLALGARPSLLFGAAILLVPVAQAWRERRKVWVPLLAAIVPMALIGLGLMLYNWLRFDSPFEFGFRYQLAGDRHLTGQFFSLRYLWFNFRMYFLELARWNGRFPFVHDIIVPPMPAGHWQVEETFGVLTNDPLVWLALAVPLAWRSRSAESRSCLCWFLIAVTMLFGIVALTLGLYYFTAGRFQMEFLPELMLLAAIGILSLDRALANRPVGRRAARWGWVLLLGFSVAFNLLVSVERSAEAHNNLANVLVSQGRLPEAIKHYEQAVRLKDDYAAAHNSLANALVSQGRLPEAIEHYEQALRLTNEYAKVQNNLAGALVGLGRLPEAIEHYEQALQVNPHDAKAHYNLGGALLRAGKLSEAIEHYEQALRIKPDFIQAHNDLGAALMEQGRLTEAIEHYEQALHIKPDYADAHYNLGAALESAGQSQEAIKHYEQALQIDPHFVQAHNNLGTALMERGQLPAAIEHFEQALHIKPDDAEAHYNLGVALEKSHRPQEAISQYEQALRIRPDFVEAKKNLERARASE